MSQHPIRTLLLAGSAVIAAISATAINPAPSPAQKSILHTNRESDSDLEVTGLVAGLEPGESAYIRRTDLLKLLQTRAIITDDPDYPGPPLHVSGVTFDTLAAAIHPLPQSDLIDATCADRYRSHFPAQYIAQHQPILVLTIDGKPLDVWSKQAHQYNPAPYVVMYPHFVPAFKVLSHEDRPQLPDNLIRLNYSTQASTFGAIEPHDNYPPNSPEQIGFTIAKQNCLRCHFMGQYGGTKSGRDWRSLSTWAREQPAFFKRYVHNPQAVDPHAHMEGSPGYDDATLSALAAYFRTFTASGPATSVKEPTH
jgi:hypothetical protein